MEHEEIVLMSIGHDSSLDLTVGRVPLPQVPVSTDQKPLHRIAEVRRRQGISVRSVARRLHISIDQVRREEEPASDMLLSELLRWQQALEVPLAELLVETDGPLSEPVMNRARLLRIMKTVRAIEEMATSPSIQRFATMLEEQLVELMPELKDVAAWHSIGQRRSHNELGRIEERILPDTFYRDSME
jgi:transcriptional regulator with XRE-family HTH domain